MDRRAFLQEFRVRDHLYARFRALLFDELLDAPRGARRNGTLVDDHLGAIAVPCDRPCDVEDEVKIRRAILLSRSADAVEDDGSKLNCFFCVSRECEPLFFLILPDELPKPRLVERDLTFVKLCYLFFINIAAE